MAHLADARLTLAWHTKRVKRTDSEQNKLLIRKWRGGGGGGEFVKKKQAEKKTAAPRVEKQKMV